MQKKLEIIIHTNFRTGQIPDKLNNNENYLYIHAMKTRLFIKHVFLLALIFNGDFGLSQKINQSILYNNIDPEINKGYFYFQRAKNAFEKESDSTSFYIKVSKEYNLSNSYFELYIKTQLLAISLSQRKGKFKKTIQLAKNGIDIAKSTSNEKYLAKFYNHQTAAYFMLTDYTNRYESNKKAFKYARKYNDSLDLLIAHSGLISFYASMQEYDKAIDHSVLACKLAKSPARKRNLLTNKAFYHFENNEHLIAINLMTRIRFESQTAREKARLDEALAVIYYSMDSLDISLRYLNKAYGFFKNTNENLRIININYYKGMIYFKLKNYKASTNHLDIARIIAKKNSIINLEYKIYKTKYKIAKVFNQTDSALFFFENYKTLEDSINSLKNLKELSIKEWKNRMTFNIKENLLLEEKTLILNDKLAIEKKMNKWFVLGLTSTLLLIVLLIIIIILRKKNNQKKRQIVKYKFAKKLELKNKELVTLKIQRLNRGKKIEGLNDKMTALKSSLNVENLNIEKITKDIRSMSSQIDFDTEKDWEEFKLYFEKLNENFFFKLNEKYPKITLNDHKLCAYIKIDMTTKQISRVLNVLPDTITRQKNRLRQKMNLPKKAEIKSYLNF